MLALTTPLLLAMAASELLATQARRTSGQTDPAQAGSAAAATDDAGVPANQATDPPSS
ncbi:hypothetical protein [Aeromonas sp. A35_P]|uniref:hypothetical protein n=1 Tax=Aeromonas sp. A35_P TaxID=1983805 RepID=UPI00159622FA|nr:hypothetical protein [Aeromonas sp. A35_P]